MAQSDKSIKLTIEAGTKDVGKIDSLIKRLEGMGVEVSDVSDEFGGLKKELDAIGRKSGAIERMESVNRVIDATSTELAAATEKATRLGRELSQAAKPTKRLTNEFERASAKVRELKQRLAEEREALKSASNAAKAAGVDTKRLVAEKVRLSAQSAIAAEKTRVLKTGLTKLNNEMRKGGKSAKNMRDGISSISVQLNRLQKLAGAFYIGKGFANSLGDLASVADSYKLLQGRIQLVSDTQEEYNRAQQETSQIAKDTRTGLEDVISLYTRLRFVQKDQNVAQADTLKLTRLMTQALKISGASQAESAATLTQLTQAFSSGVLRGEEFNSMMEQGPRLAKALADGLGVPVSALRGMAEAGEITSDKLANALIGQAKIIEDEYRTLPQTIGGALTNINTSWLEYVGQVNDATGASKIAVEALNSLANNLDAVIQSVVNLAGAGFIVWLGSLVVQLRGAVVEMIALRTATTSMGEASLAASAKVQKLSKVMKAAGWVGVAIAVKELTENLWDLYETYDAVNTAQEQQQKNQAALQEKIQRYLTTYKDWAQTQIKTEEEIAQLSEHRASEYEKQLNAAAHYWQALSLQLKQQGSDYAWAEEKARGYFAALSKLNEQMDKHAGVTTAAAATYFTLIQNAETAEQVGNALSAAMVGLAGDTERQAMASLMAADRIKQLSDEEERLAEETKKTAKAQEEKRRAQESSLVSTLESARADARSKKSTLELAIAHIKLLKQKKQLELSRKKGILSQKEYDKQSKELAKTLKELIKLENELHGQQQQQQQQTDGVGDSTKNAGDRQKQFNEVLTETMTIGEKMAKHLEFWQQEMDGLSEASRRAFDSMVATINKTEGALVTSFDMSSQAAQDNSAQIQELSRQIQHMRSAYDQATGDVNRWMIAVETAGLVVKREFLAQEDAAAKLEARLDNLNGLTEEQARSFQQAAAGYTLLDQSRLDGIQSRIESLRQSTEALNDSISSTLNNLLNELDRYNNNLVEIERRKYEEQKARILEQLRQAQMANDAKAIAEAQKALAVLDQLYQKRLELARERQEKAGGATGSAGNVSYGGSGSSSSQNDGLQTSGSISGSFAGQRAPARHVLEIRTPSGSREVGVNSEADVATLIDALEQSGLVAT